MNKLLSDTEEDELTDWFDTLQYILETVYEKDIYEYQRRGLTGARLMDGLNALSRIRTTV